MTEQSISISEAKNKLAYLPEQFAEDPIAVTVTRYRKPVMTILPYETYKKFQRVLEAILSLQETLEILQDEELMAAFRNGVKALERGATVAWEDVKKELGLE